MMIKQIQSEKKEDSFYKLRTSYKKVQLKDYNYELI